MSFKKTTFRHIFQIGSYKYAAHVLNFMASVILARLLLPEEYGLVAMIMVVANFARILSGEGIASDIIRSKYGYTYHKSLMNLAIFLGFILCILVILAAWPVALFFGNRELILPTIVLSIQFIFIGINIVQYALLLKKQQYSKLGQIELSSAVLTISLMIAMAWFGFSYWSLIVPVIIAEIFRVYMYYRYTGFKIKFFPLKYPVVAFKYAKSIMGSILGVRIISYWGRNLDNILIGRFFGEASVGIYNRGYKFTDLVSGLFERLFNSVLYPNLQKLKDEDGDVFGEYLFFIGVMCFLSFPISGILLIFPVTLVRILWGPDWLMVAEYLPYFGLAIMSQASVSNTETLYKIYYKDLLLFKIGVFRSIMVVVFIIIGSLFSALMIARMVALVQIIVIIPVTVFYSFGRELGFSKGLLLRLYLPRILLFSAMFITVWKEMDLLTLLLLTLYLIHLLIIQKNDLYRLKAFVMEKLKAGRKK
jgi:O-antigen/teichoic acid export membrane protein